MVECREISDVFAFPARNTRHDVGIGSHRVAREGCVIALHDAWNRFCRGIVLYSAYHSFVTRSGVVHRPAMGRNQRDALLHLKVNAASISSKSHGEPNWYIPAATIDAALLLQVPNSSTISAAVGVSSLRSVVSPTAGVQANSSPPAEIQSVRNYIAHRGSSAGKRIKPLKATHGASNVLQILDAPVAGGLRLFDSWVSDLLDMADFATR